jgi:two-component system sensor histidine kinase ChvG
MLVSATAGYLRNKLGFVWRLRSLRAKTAVLAVIFAAVPLFLYAEFRKAYHDSQGLLLQSVRDQGRVISQSLLPLLDNADSAALPGLGQQLERFAGQVTTIKLLLAPAGADGDGFYYIASWPPS